MAKRKKKDSTEEVITGVFMLIIIGVFTYSNSLTTGIVVGLLFLIVILVIMKIINSKRTRKINESGILQVDSMTGDQFERFLKIRYISMGYIVKDTPRTGDFGADLILIKDSKRIVVQAKRYAKTVGIKGVQEVIGAKPHYKADEAWVVTNNYFTKAAEKLAISNNVKLVNRDQLINILSKPPNRLSE